MRLRFLCVTGYLSFYSAKSCIVNQVFCEVLLGTKTRADFAGFQLHMALALAPPKTYRSPREGFNYRERRGLPVSVFGRIALSASEIGEDCSV
jgi:hypothetical protein